MRILCLILILCLEVRLSKGWTCQGPTWLCEAVLTAGEERDERERYDLLLSLSTQVQQDQDLASELDQLLLVVDKWANGLEKYWSNDTQQITGVSESIEPSIPSAR